MLVINDYDDDDIKVRITSKVTHGSNYMLENNRTESDRAVRKKGGH